jgi:hypothetical protein
MLSRVALVDSRKTVGEFVSTSLRKFSNSNKFRPRRRPGKNYRAAATVPLKKVHPKQKKSRGPKDPNDVSTPPRPSINFSNIKITDVFDEGEYQSADDLIAEFGNLTGGALNMARRELEHGEIDLETKLKMMDYFTSAPGSTEDLVGERRILALETPDEQERLALMEKIDRLVEQERLANMELPATDPITLEDLEIEQSSGSTSIPHNQLAHGDWYVHTINEFSQSDMI